MKKIAFVLILVLLVAAAFFLFHGCQPEPQPPVTPPTPPVVVVPTTPPIVTTPPVVKPPEPPPLPPTPVRVIKTVKLDRADFSGIYVLPAGVTWFNVLELYIDGKPVNKDRVTFTHEDEVDVWDARLPSKITAKIIQ